MILVYPCVGRKHKSKSGSSYYTTAVVSMPTFTTVRALVISGGGSKGAWAGGLASRMIQEATQRYQMYLGTSTGSLLVPLLAANEFDAVREVFTQVNQASIFSSSPFRVKANADGTHKVSINHLGILRMFLRRKKTLGESKNLLKLIQCTFTQEIYDKLRSQIPDVIVTVANLTMDRAEYKSIKDCSYDQWCHWMWASCNVAPFMSVYEHAGMTYVDGGYGSYAPIKEAISRGAKEIDVIILRTADERRERMDIRNVANLWTSTIDFMHHRIADNDIEIGKSMAIKRHCRLRLYYLPEPLTDNALIFDPVQMKKWWTLGADYYDHRQPTEIDWTYSR